MAKMIIVEDCKDCPFRATAKPIDAEIEICGFITTLGKIIDDINRISPWCELPDYPEEGKDETSKC